MKQNKVVVVEGAYSVLIAAEAKLRQDLLIAGLRNDQQADDQERAAFLAQNVKDVADNQVAWRKFIHRPTIDRSAIRSSGGTITLNEGSQELLVQVYQCI